MTVRIAAVMTCHNRRDKTLQCLAGLAAQDADGVRIDPVVVDDGSTDGTADAVRAEFPSATVVEGDGDLFWAGGMRVALDAAAAGDYDHYLWLNDDVSLDVDAVATLVRTAGELRARGVEAIVVGSTRDPATGAVTYGGRYRPSRRRPSRFRVLPPAATPQPVETMNGNVVLVPRAVAARVGNLDGYRHSFADQDYGLRARAAGFEVWVAPGTVGTCAANPNPTYGRRYGDRPWRDEVRALVGVKGLLPRDWLTFSRRWHGPLWPWFFASPYLHGLLRIGAAHAGRRGEGATPATSTSASGAAASGGPRVFVVWRAYQGRVDAMCGALGLEAHYLGARSRWKVARPVEYVAKSWATYRLLRRRRPSEVWLQVPPTVKLHVAALYKRRHPEVRIVADCHNIMLERPWISTPGLRRLLDGPVDVALVHNPRVHERALALGFPSGRTLELRTAPAVDDLPPARPDLDLPHPWALFPASFKADEPVEALVEAARRVPDVTLAVTGHRADAAHRVRDLPPNVRLLGWVDKVTYKALVAGADVVIGLTTLDDVQLSVANEAYGFGRAMVLSDTPLLRRLFPRGAVHVGHRPDELADGIRRALAEQAQLEIDSKEMSRDLQELWRRQADEVLRRLGRAAPDGEGRR